MQLLTTFWCPPDTPSHNNEPCLVRLSDILCRLHPGTPARWWLVGCLNPGNIKTTWTGCSGPLIQWSMSTAYMRITMIPIAIVAVSLGLSVNRITGCKWEMQPVTSRFYSWCWIKPSLRCQYCMTFLHPLAMIWLSKLVSATDSLLAMK